MKSCFFIDEIVFLFNQYQTFTLLRSPDDDNEDDECNKFPARRLLERQPKRKVNFYFRQFNFSWQCFFPVCNLEPRTSSSVLSRLGSRWPSRKVGKHDHRLHTLVSPSLVITVHWGKVYTSRPHWIWQNVLLSLVYFCDDRLFCRAV